MSFIITFDMEGMKFAPAHMTNAGDFCDWWMKLSINLPRCWVRIQKHTTMSKSCVVDQSLSLLLFKQAPHFSYICLNKMLQNMASV